MSGPRRNSTGSQPASWSFRTQTGEANLGMVLTPHEAYRQDECGGSCKSKPTTATVDMGNG